MIAQGPGGGGGLPYKCIRGRAEICGILLELRNPDFGVVLGGHPNVLDFRV